MNLEQRDFKLDILKAIGLACIILAHVSPNETISQLRNFDVPLMVLVSGALFEISSRQKNLATFDYVKRRIPRLIAPVWIFFAFFFLFTYIVCTLSGQAYPYTARETVDTFLLIQGIGFVWIIRVFVAIALVAPWIKKALSFTENNRLRLIAIFGVYVLFEILNYFWGDLDTPVLGIAFIYFWFGKFYFILYHLFFKRVVLYVLPYGCVFALGIVISQLRRKTILLMSAFFLAVFSAIALFLFLDNGMIISTQVYKYPPQTYYFSYALFVSCLLYYLFDKFLQHYPQIIFKSKRLSQSIVFVSTSSMWIYLWHIWSLVYLPEILGDWWIWKQTVFGRFLIVFLFSSLITYTQKIGVSRLIQKTQLGRSHARWISVLFLK
ncbi:acyltransferase family protein [Baaleninema sp.]|uniref:acyltransferase family protein n=1 Tax=Baaleninema sp. TaxID=3101197 RepID=UPI003D01E9C2